MQNRDAEGSIRVDVWVVNGNQEAELRRLVWVVVGKYHLSSEIASVEGAVGVDDHEGETPFLDVHIIGVKVHPFFLL